MTIKLALIAGLGSVVLIGLSVALRTDATIVERDLYANMADLETETRRALRELRGELRQATPAHEGTKAVASVKPRQALPYDEQEEQRRPRPIPQGTAEYFPRRVEEREAEAYVPETTAVPRQRREDDYAPAEREPRPAARRQAMEAWHAEEPSNAQRRSRGVEDGWSDEVYTSGSTPRSRATAPEPATGGRGRHYREDDPRSGEIPRPVDTGSARRGEYASGSRSRGTGSSYMDTYYGDSRR